MNCEFGNFECLDGLGNKNLWKFELFSIVDIMFKVTIDGFIAMWKILKGFTLKCFKINVLTYSLNVFLVLNLNTNKVDFYNLFLTNEN